MFTREAHGSSVEVRGSSNAPAASRSHLVEDGVHKDPVEGSEVGEKSSQDRTLPNYGAT